MSKAYDNILEALNTRTDAVTNDSIEALIKEQIEFFADYPVAREAVQNQLLLISFSVVGSFNPLTKKSSELADRFVTLTTDDKKNHQDIFEELF